MRTDLVWFKRDLRIDDNPALAGAATADRVICLYCWDARHEQASAYNGHAKCGPHRQAFIAQALADLARAVASRGGALIVRSGEPEDEIAALVDQYAVHTVWAETERAPEEAAQVAHVADRLAGRAELALTPDNTLYRCDQLPFGLDDMPRVFTKFRKQIEDTIDNALPQAGVSRLPPLPEGLGESLDLTFAERLAGEPPRFIGGESAGRERLDYYLWGSDRIASYKQTRNGLLGDDYSSKFSPWLANGCLSARRVAAEVARYEADVEANKSTYWLIFELRWREFFHWIATRAGSQLFDRGGLLGRDDRPTACDESVLAAWRKGRTGMPFVDANMRELAATGYMSNRGRQNVASFLARDLAQDWRTGAAWFEHALLDYDVASNWGNWATVAGVGTDKRDNGFNVMAQATRYDPDAAYISYWLPELRAIPARLRHAPWLAGSQALADAQYPMIAEVPSAWQGHLPDKPA